MAVGGSTGWGLYPNTNANESGPKVMRKEMVVVTEDDGGCGGENGVSFSLSLS